MAQLKDLKFEMWTGSATQLTTLKNADLGAFLLHVWGEAQVNGGTFAILTTRSLQAFDLIHEIVFSAPAYWDGWKANRPHRAFDLPRNGQLLVVPASAGVEMLSGRRFKGALVEHGLDPDLYHHLYWRMRA